MGKIENFLKCYFKCCFWRKMAEENEDFDAYNDKTKEDNKDYNDDVKDDEDDEDDEDEGDEE